MTETERHEIINAARSYERIVAERREMFVATIRLAREGQQAEGVKARQDYFSSKPRQRKAEELLAERIYPNCDFVRVDDVVYIGHSPETLLRIPLNSIDDIAKTPDLVVNQETNL